MAFPERLAIDSRNLYKLREIRAICADWPVRWITAEDHEGEWPDVDEPHDTYLDNGTLGGRIKLYVEKNFPD